MDACLSKLIRNVHLMEACLSKLIRNVQKVFPCLQHIYSTPSPLPVPIFKASEPGHVILHN